MRDSKIIKFSDRWLAEFDWLVYSSIAGGGFCKFCFFFAVGGNVGSLLIKTHFNNYNKNRESFTNHAKTSYHIRSVETAKTLNIITKNPETSIEKLLTKQKELERQQNLILLNSVFDTINYLARQSMPFRGHRDS